MTAQPTRDQLRALAQDHAYIHPDAILAMLDQLDQAEARIKAVRDVLRRGPYEDARGNAAVRANEIRRALDGD